MQSRAKGIVAIEPKYMKATESADSYIYFRLRCDLSINGKTHTEFYPVKAFGKVADFLRDNIQMNSELYIEALARSYRYTKGGVDQMRIEFHVFMAHIIQTGQTIDTRTNEAAKRLCTPKEPSMSSETTAKLKDDMKWQKMTPEQVKSVSEKFRSVYAEQKQLHPGNISNPQETINSPVKKKPATQQSAARGKSVQVPQVHTEAQRSVGMQAWVTSSGSNATAAVIAARMSLKDKLSSSGSDVPVCDYSAVRG